GNDADRIFLECMCALLDDPDTGALAFCVDLTTETVPEAGYSLVAREVFSRTSKPMAVLANMASAVDRRDAGFVRGAGMPVLEGTATGLAEFASDWAVPTSFGPPTSSCPEFWVLSCW